MESSPSPAYPIYRKRPIAWVTWLLLCSTVSVFLLQLRSYHLYGTDSIGDTLAFSPQAWADHRYWTLVTYAWAHAVAMFGDQDLFWLHIVANMIPLFCLGPALEEFLGHWSYLALYLGSALAAALVWFACNGADEGPGIIGASGAIFGLIAGAGTAAPRARITVYLFFILPLRMSMSVLALVVCALEAAQIVLGWLPEVAHSAHLGGATFGFLYVLTVRFLSRKQSFIS